MSDELQCSFCETKQSEVSLLIAGANDSVFICDRCALMTYEIVMSSQAREKEVKDGDQKQEAAGDAAPGGTQP